MLQGRVWIQTFYLVHDNRLFQNAKVISVSSVVMTCGSIWKFHFSLVCILYSFSAAVCIVMSFCV